MQGWEASFHVLDRSNPRGRAGETGAHAVRSELTESEVKVLRDSASSTNSEQPGENDDRPPVRPEFIRWLATDPEAATHIDPKGLRVVSLTISGRLDLRECEHLPTLDFWCCTFDGEVDLRSAETKGIFFRDCSAHGLIGAGQKSPVKMLGHKLLVLDVIAMDSDLVRMAPGHGARSRALAPVQGIARAGSIAGEKIPEPETGPYPLRPQCTQLLHCFDVLSAG